MVNPDDKFECTDGFYCADFNFEFSFENSRIYCDFSLRCKIVFSATQKLKFFSLLKIEERNARTLLFYSGVAENKTFSPSITSLNKSAVSFMEQKTHSDPLLTDSLFRILLIIFSSSFCRSFENFFPSLAANPISRGPK